MAVVTQGEGGPVAILNRKEPAFYTIPAKTFERMYDILEDIELQSIVGKRKSQPGMKADRDEL